MLTTAQALEAILAAMPELPAEAVSLQDSAGRVLRQTVIAERDQPPFDRVMMDGIAIAHAAFVDGRTAFPVQATQAAGDPALSLEPGAAIEIMTGAALPENADCVVPVERITVEDGVATLDEDYEPAHRQFIHTQASDHAAGSELLRPGRRIAPADIAVIASAGLASVSVTRPAVTRVISTGNELVAAGEVVAPHQIRMSNGPALVALLARHGHTECAHEHIADDPSALRERIGAHLDEADALILSGGVSMGKIKRRNPAASGTNRADSDWPPAVVRFAPADVLFHKYRARACRFG